MKWPGRPATRRATTSGGPSRWTKTWLGAASRAGDLQPYLEADILFHRTLLEASGNEMLAALADVVAEVLSGRTLHGLMPATPEPGAIRLHADVAQAVQARDADAAHRAMSEIITEATGAMLAGGS